jgi:hypothetical protein
MPQERHGLNPKWIRTLLAGIFLLTCVSASIGQCVDSPERRRKEAEAPPQPRGYQNPDFCDPQLSQAPGFIYQPCRPCEDTLPLKQIKEDRAYLEFLSQSVLVTGAGGNQLDLPAVNQWASELRKRVRRLKTELALPETEDCVAPMSEGAQVVPSDRIELARAVIVLSSLIRESLRNPVLSGRLLDQGLSAKAVRDLGQIEMLAGLIQSGCQRLSNSSR